jgi:hypothetical protein
LASEERLSSMTSVNCLNNLLSCSIYLISVLSYRIIKLMEK